ncbi:MAG: plasmid mobilization relaxosome protein MobC [bacterium]|nr:plasmid mobilization relaxosome protein MobC [bacterium]
MANRKRKMVLRCPVTEEERKLIEQKMALLHTDQIGAYLRKMAIDGLIIYTDTSNIKEFTQELQAIGRNVNQIARRVNASGSAYDEDIAEIKERLKEIWHIQRRILSQLP